MPEDIDPASERRLTELAEAIADGRPLDWDSIELSTPDAEERLVIAHLRAISQIADLRIASDSVSASSAASRFLSTTGATASPERTAIGRWGLLQILERVGAGSFGDVYRAWDPTLDREVALKLLRRRANEPDDTLVVEEGRLMARVRHQNVVTIYGAQRIDGQTGLWMEFIRGRTLDAELRERGPFDVANLLRVGIELSRALAAVHAAGLVHRDVKAQNVMREEGGRLVLGDFGTGRELEDLASSERMAGTPAYLAPEIFGGAPATPQSDLYSLGALLFYLATGRHPVPGRSVRELREAHARGSHQPILEARADLPPPLAAVIDRALEPDPHRRFESAREMETNLADSIADRERRSNRPKRWVAAVTMATIVVLGTGIVAWRNRDGSSREPPGQNTTALAMAVNGSQSQRQLSDDPTLAGPGSPSPDGRFLSFVWDGDLAVHDFATGQRRKVTTENHPPDRYKGEAETSRFSADGESLFYVWYPLPAGSSSDGVRPSPELRQIAVGGGSSRILWRAPEGSYLTLQHWSGNDDLVLGVLTYDKKPGEIIAVGNPNGEVKRWFRLSYVNYSPVTASLSPDARYVAFDAQNEAGISSVYVVGTDSAADDVTAALIADGVNDLAPMWTRDGRHLLFLSDRSGNVGLWAQRVDGMRAEGPPIVIEPSLGASYPMGLTHTDAYVFRRQVGGRDVYVAKLDDRTGLVAGEPSRLSPERGDATGTSDWSHDGGKIVFFRRRDFRRSLVIRTLATGQEREFSESLDGVARPRWEPGDQSILFKGVYRDVGGLHRLDVKTGRITTVTQIGVGLYELTPDGSALIYTADRRQFMRYDLRTHRQQLLHDPKGFISGLAISAAGDRLAYTALIGGSRLLRVIDIANPQVVHEVLNAPRSEGLHVFAWTPDDQSVLVYRSGRKTADDGVWNFGVETQSGWPIGLRPEAFQEARLSASGRELSFDLGSPFQEPWVLENVLSRLK